METTNQRDPNKTTIITSSDMNQRTFRDEESWASLESTILGGNCAIHDETESSSSCTADGIDSAKSKLATVSEEQCTDEARGTGEFGNQEEEADEDEEDNNVLNMNIDAIDDEEVFFDCPIILSPRPYFLGPAPFRPVSPRPFISPRQSTSRTRPFLTITTTCNGTTFTTSASSLGTTSGDSGLDAERTGAMIGQIVDDFNDMGEHAQSTPKIIAESSELGSSISSANNLASEDKSEKDDCVVTGEPLDLEISTKKRLEYPMDDDSENDTTANRKKKIEVPAETYEFVKNLDYDEKRNDSNNNIVTAKKRLERPSEIVRRMKVLCEKLNSVTEPETDNNNKKLESSESAKRKLSAKKSDPASCEQPGSQKESSSMNESEANNNNKLENSESAKEKIGAQKSDSTNREKPRGNVNITRSIIRPPKPINKFYKCRSPADKSNKENYYAGKYSNVKKIISPLPTGLKQPTQRVAKMKEFFENRSRVGTNSTSKKPLIGQKRSPKGPSFHTTTARKLRRSSPKPSQASQASSLEASSCNPIHDATTLLLTRNQSRFLRPSSCSDYSSTTSSCADKFDQLSAAQKSKSMEDLSSESAQAAELRRFAMAKHITKRAYLKVMQHSTLLKRTPKKQPSPQLLAVCKTPKKSKSDIMKRKSFGFVSSPVKPVTELRKIFSPCTASNAKTVKKHAGRTSSKTLPHIIINGI